jgi:hypothetical protein
MKKLFLFCSLTLSLMSFMSVESQEVAITRDCANIASRVIATYPKVVVRDCANFASVCAEIYESEHGCLSTKNYNKFYSQAFSVCAAL